MLLGVSGNFQNTLIPHKQLETNQCVINTVATDVLAQKHQTISIHIADKMFFVLGQFHTKLLWWKNIRQWNHILKTTTKLLKV